MPKAILVAVFGMWVSAICVGAQSSRTPTSSRSPSSKESTCTLTDDRNWSWISCSAGGPVLRSLEEQSISFSAGRNTFDKSTSIVFPGEKSSSRITADQGVTIKFRSPKDVTPAVIIFSLTVEKGTRKAELDDVRHIPALHWTQVNKTTVHLSGVDPLPPGEYVVLAGASGTNVPVDVKEGDEAFLFGVD
jgi:hypothetical protein